MADLLEKIIEAKEIKGDDIALDIAKYLNVEKFNESRKVGCCPFHEENTPSFTWNIKDKSFKCFGCGKTFGVLDMYTETEGSYFNGLKKLFEETGVEYNFKNSKGQQTDYFKNYIYPKEEENTKRDKVETYLGLRGISKHTLDRAGIKQDSYGNIVFEGRDIDNKLLYVKYRKSGKVKKGEPKMWYQKNASNCPSFFNMNNIDITKPILIQEGEVDSLSVIESGFFNTVSIPHGASDTSWIEFNFDFLEQFNEIILWFDNDKAGQSAISNVVSRLGEYRCKIVKPTDSHEDEVEKFFKQYDTSVTIRKTDANNVLLACGKQTVLSLIKNAEEVPSKKLKFLMDCEMLDIRDMEKVSTGYKELDKIMYGSLFPCFSIITGYAGCVDEATEFFNGYEWKKIRDYKKGDKVLQYNTDGTTTLIEPIEYHKYKSDYLYRFSVENSLDQCLSNEHNVYYIDKEAKTLASKQFREIREIHNNSDFGFDGEFITNFQPNIANSVDISNNDLEFLINCLHNGLNIKSFNVKNLYNCSQEQFKEICEIYLEMQKHKIIITESFDKEYIDVVQFAFVNCGYNVYIYERYIKEISQSMYSVNIDISKQDELHSLYNEFEKPQIEEYKTVDGFKYCFTTHSGMWVMRRNNKICVTGNSGKSSFSNITSILTPIEQGYKTFVFSGELHEGQLANWIISPLAGYNHTVEWKNEKNGSKGYSVTKEAEDAIREYYKKNIILYSDEDELSTSGEDILKEMENAYRRYGCKVFVIDNLMCINFENPESENKWASQKQFIIQLMKFTNKYNVNVNLVLHPRKPSQSQTQTVYDLHGASEIGNLCHRLIWINRLKDDPEGYNVEVKIIKDRPTGKSNETCKMCYDTKTHRIYSNPYEQKFPYGWEKEFKATYSQDITSRLIKNLPDDSLGLGCDQY